METPELINWTMTHGGPYYVEVGKNIEIKYHTKLNVTKTKAITSSTSNTTNGTNTTSNTTTPTTTTT